MKFSDYKRLGKISISSRKKSTRNTVRGISFGLILLIPIVFFALAFYSDLTKKINEVNSISSFRITTKHYNSAPGDIIATNTDYYQTGEYPIIGFERQKTITNLDGVEDYLVSEYFHINELYENSFSHEGYTSKSNLILNGEKIPLGNGAVDLPEELHNMFPNNTFKILHQDLSSEPYITKGEADDLLNYYNNSNIFIEGNGFIGDGKGQIILSERFLETFNINSKDIINQNISLEVKVTTQYDFIIDNDFDSSNELSDNAEELFYQKYINMPITVFKDFMVVGVISNDLYTLQSRINESDIWFHKSSLPDEKYTAPKIVHHNIGDDDWSRYVFVVTYEDNPLDIADNITNDSMIFMPIGLGGNYYSPGMTYYYTFPILSTIIQCESYQKATEVEASINAIYDFVFGKNSYYNFTNYIYMIFSMIYEVGLYVILVLMIFGGIIFFATLLNLYNSINYSVQSRRNYIGVMRAIGAQESTIPRLYFIEIMLVFMRAFIWVLIFSGLLSYGIKALVDSGFKDVSEVLNLSLSINFVYFPITIVILVIVEFLIAFVYSQVACRTVSKKPILEILKDEK